MTTRVRVGTCSWADESLLSTWYPRQVRSPDQRLRHYAARFDTVEVNSSYYALPAAETAAAWARRTPDGFVFHVKAFGLMTRHPVRVEQLPADLRSQAAVDHLGRVDHPSEELRGAVFDRFLAGVRPLRESGRMGGVLMQMPPYVVFKPSSFAYLEWAQERLDGCQLMVEFRHRSWFEEGAAAQVLSFLEQRGMAHVIVDAPRSQARNLVPTVIAATTPTAYLRLHGRNAATWQVRGRSAAERFDHLYSRAELAEWVEPLRELAQIADHTFAMFNNNGATMLESGARIAQAPVNADMLRELLDESGVPVSRPSETPLL
ncbi:MAG TPA: DUF72 domain-containing protein [Gaiellales bacterium]|nr:DUF72 domain-containing protein [Gaiellales bacterium]